MISRFQDFKISRFQDFRISRSHVMTDLGEVEGFSEAAVVDVPFEEEVEVGSGMEWGGYAVYGNREDDFKISRFQDFNISRSKDLDFSRSQVMTDLHGVARGGIRTPASSS
jgi:hypothetical protein